MMIQVIYDYDGNKIGAYDGDNDNAKLYDANGDYLGEILGSWNLWQNM